MTHQWWLFLARYMRGEKNRWLVVHRVCDFMQVGHDNELSDGFPHRTDNLPRSQIGSTAQILLDRREHEADRKGWAAPDNLLSKQLNSPVVAPTGCSDGITDVLEGIGGDI